MLIKDRFPVGFQVPAAPQADGMKGGEQRLAVVHNKWQAPRLLQYKSPDTCTRWIHTKHQTRKQPMVCKPPQQQPMRTLTWSKLLLVSFYGI